MPYKYNSEKNILIEQPEMKEPDSSYAQFDNLTATGKQNYMEAVLKYKEHITSLETYPVSGNVPEYWIGRDLSHSIDFYIDDEIAYPISRTIMKENKKEEVNESQEAWFG